LRINQSFRDKIAETFYDKTLSLYSVGETVDAEGFARQEATETETTFTGNVRFDNFDEVQKDFGLDDKIDMTCTTGTEVSSGSIIGYDGRTYKVLKCVPYDSHYMLIAQVWLQKSSTSISV
jgi:hypothetical protein